MWRLGGGGGGGGGLVMTVQFICSNLRLKSLIRMAAVTVLPYTLYSNN